MYPDLISAGAIVLSVAALDTVEILWLGVNPIFREKEIGTLLLKEAFKLTRKLGHSRIIVGVPQTAEEYGITKRFFASRGFRESGISYREQDIGASHREQSRCG